MVSACWSSQKKKSTFGFDGDAAGAAPAESIASTMSERKRREEGMRLNEVGGDGVSRGGASESERLSLPKNRNTEKSPGTPGGLSKLPAEMEAFIIVYLFEGTVQAIAWRPRADGGRREHLYRSSQ